MIEAHASSRLVSQPSGTMSHRAPRSNEALRAALYAGKVLHLPPTRASIALCDAVEGLLVDELGTTPRVAHEWLGSAGVFEAIGRLRKRVYLDPRFHGHLRATLEELGFDNAHIAFDPARLRAVLHRGHDHPAARPAYLAHRDTWYALPDAVISWWIPLADLAKCETFVLHPEHFARAVANDSERFDYRSWAGSDWARKIGWQDRESGLAGHYPSALADLPGEAAMGFSCRRAANLLFSGAHLHRTLPQALGTIRFSVDFRIVHLDDQRAARGAPNVDNRSQGNAIDDFVLPGRPWPAGR